ncbi:MAG: hypothetical protein LBS20_08795 [Prevotella sp.]|jgi:hypothetical protein|nr:hypothetical protein [Prevotella sp.]
MTKKGKKRLKIILITLALLIAGGFGLNWYLTYQLEDSLRQKFREEVSKATNGFYSFSYNHLSVGFFSGELIINGVELIPDSAVFEKWKNGDSLPDLYYKVKIDKIHFKGINLTWRRNYKNLDFSLFELKSPDIKVFQPQLHSSLKSSLDGQQNKERETLYQMISTYIDVLTVKQINLGNANIYYIVEDSISPVQYALSDANFNAYGFRLDKDSYSSGKLLYCDNFEFTADKPQQLLYSNQLILNTRNIKLSTIDELVQIEGVHLHPTDDFWAGRMEKAGDYLDATIKSVFIKGVKFKRENALNYLNADSFDISSTDIQYYSVKDKSAAQDGDSLKQNNADNDQAWSLYSITSPILQSISIEKIGIEKTRFHYTFTQDGKSDTYSLEQFDFHAKNFVIDSLSEKQKKFWYVDNFAMSATDIKGLIASNNSEVSIAALTLNTESKYFNISDIKVNPTSIVNVRKDYFSGTIKSIRIDGLNYDTGVSAEELKIESPDIRYFKVKKQNKPDSSKKDEIEISDDALNIFNPYADYLSVKNINLANANIIIHDLGTKDDFRLQKLNFYAVKFLIDEETRKTEKYLFTCDDIGLSFKDFDNLLPGKNYRLQIKDANISTLTGLLLLRDVKLIPQENIWDKAPATYYDIDIPLIRVKGFDNDSYLNKEKAKIKSLEVNSPWIQIIKTANSPVNKDDKTSSGNAISVIKSLEANNIDIKNVQVSYIDRVSRDSLHTALQALQLHSLQWDLNRNFRIDKFVLESPKVDYIAKQISSPSENNLQTKGNPGDIDELLKIFGKKITIGTFTLSNGIFNIQKPDISFGAELENFDLSAIDWNHLTGKSFLDMASVNITKPTLDIRKRNLGDTIPMQKKDSSGTDLYSSLHPYINKLSIKKFNLADAHINYEHSLDEKQQDRQTVNTTNLGMTGFFIDTDARKVDMEDIRFNTKDLHFPIMNGFYTIDIGEIDVNKKNASLALSGIKMTSVYPKMDFAYKHPTHMDWFDVTTGNISLSGVDYRTYLSDNILNAKRLVVKDVMLQNLKNKKIYTPPKLQPLIYTKLYDLPFRIAIDTTDVSNFSVIYEELPKNGTVPGQISFMGMNARIDGLTNIASHPQQYMHLNANGNLMGTGYFTAKWDMSVSSDYDCFVLDAHLHRFDLRDLNQIITPLAKAEIKSGTLKDLTFRTEASSMNASVGMKFLYNDLSVNILKGDDPESSNKFVTNVANAFLRSNNPNKENSKPREPYLYIERDPYHSTFNYFWQILQPAVVESVGVSQKKQNFAKKVTGFFSKVKNFFTGKKDNKPSTSQEDIRPKVLK